MKLSQYFKKKLLSIVGSDSFIEAPEGLICYAFDATNQPFIPDLVVLPQNENQISQIMTLATFHRVPVTPRGAGVGFSGGSLPIHGGVVLAMTRMNKIIDIDPDNLTATVEPGVITQDIQDAAKRYGLFYPPDPASIRSSTIGGNIAECAGGLSAVKYGVTKHYVLGMRFVLPNGSICQLGGKTVKNVVGFDLIGLLVGSEGTLAIMTQFTLKLLPLPDHRQTFLVSYEDIEAAGKSVSQIISSKVIPTAIEFMDRTAIQAVDNVLHFGFPIEAGSILIVEIDGKQQDVKKESNILRRILRSSKGTILSLSTDNSEREKIWEVRRTISPAIARLGDIKINEDIVVPRSKIPIMLKFLNSISNEYGIQIICFGHAGDGNIHVNILINKKDHRHLAQIPQILEKVFARTVSLGGVISGEHGIGLTKREYIHYNLSPEIIDLSRRIKRVFDPKMILNPGKMFPADV